MRSTIGTTPPLPHEPPCLPQRFLHPALITSRQHNTPYSADSQRKARYLQVAEDNLRYFALLTADTCHCLIWCFKYSELLCVHERSVQTHLKPRTPRVRGNAIFGTALKTSFTVDTFETASKSFSGCLPEATASTPVHASVACTSMPITILPRVDSRPASGPTA